MNSRETIAGQILAAASGHREVILHPDPTEFAQRVHPLPVDTRPPRVRPSRAQQLVIEKDSRVPRPHEAFLQNPCELAERIARVARDVATLRRMHESTDVMYLQ